MRGHIPPERIWPYYRAQCIKDDTMAMSIAEYVNQNSNSRVISFQGAFHSGKLL